MILFLNVLICFFFFNCIIVTSCSWLRMHNKLMYLMNLNVILLIKADKWVWRATTEMKWVKHCKFLKHLCDAPICPVWHCLLKSAFFFYLCEIYIYLKLLSAFFGGGRTGLESAADPPLPLTGRTRSRTRAAAANPRPAGRGARTALLTRWVRTSSARATRWLWQCLLSWHTQNPPQCSVFCAFES